MTHSVDLFVVVCVLSKPDPAIEMSAEQLREYVRTRDPKLLHFKVNSQPFEFLCKPLPPNVLMTWVDGASNAGIRTVRAFCAGCESIKLPNGDVITPQDKPTELGFGARSYSDEWFNLAAKRVGVLRLTEIAEAIITFSSLGDVDKSFLD